MHDLPDTDEADAAAERYWPDEYKWVIKNELKKTVKAGLEEDRPFASIYQRVYADRFDSYEAFADRLAEGVSIGAENGADDILDQIHNRIRKNDPLPEPRFYAVYFYPQPFDEKLKTSLYREVFEEFRAHPVYRHIYEDHYETRLSLDEFIDRLSRLVVAGVMNGADKVIGDIYRAFLLPHPYRLFAADQGGSAERSHSSSGNYVD